MDRYFLLKAGKAARDANGQEALLGEPLAFCSECYHRHRASLTIRAQHGVSVRVADLRGDPRAPPKEPRGISNTRDEQARLPTLHPPAPGPCCR